MKIRDIKRTVIATALVGAVGFVVVAFRMAVGQGTIVAVDATTPLWATEYDAARQHTIKPGPATPIAKLSKGEFLRVISSTYRKDYWAVEVEDKDGRKGWVLGAGQEGVRVISSN